MNVLKILLLLTSLALLSTSHAAHAQQQSGDSLKVLSWNIYMLPPLIYKTGKHKRARLIGQLLSESDYDVIVFQEAFHHGARRKIKRWTEDIFPYQVGPANLRYVSLRTSSGIWIISKVPIKKVESICFKKRWGLDNKMARKGALMVEGEKNGHTFQIIGTHLNAGGPLDIRMSQAAAIQNELLEPFQKENVPQIICGDFNIRKTNEAAYDKLLTTLKARDGKLKDREGKMTEIREKNDMRTWKGKGIIDFIFYRDNGRKAKSIARKIPLIRHRWHKKHQDLADHNPIEATIIW